MDYAIRMVYRALGKIGITALGQANEIDLVS